MVIWTVFATAGWIGAGAAPVVCSEIGVGLEVRLDVGFGDECRLLVTSNPRTDAASASRVE
jgi:hypothetical protein